MIKSHNFGGIREIFLLVLLFQCIQPIWLLQSRSVSVEEFVTTIFQRAQIILLSAIDYKKQDLGLMIGLLKNSFASIEDSYATSFQYITKEQFLDLLEGVTRLEFSLPCACLLTPIAIANIDSFDPEIAYGELERMEEYPAIPMNHIVTSFDSPRLIKWINKVGSNHFKKWFIWIPHRLITRKFLEHIDLSALATVHSIHEHYQAKDEVMLMIENKIHSADMYSLCKLFLIINNATDGCHLNGIRKEMGRRLCNREHITNWEFVLSIFWNCEQSKTLNASPYMASAFISEAKSSSTRIVLLCIWLEYEGVSNILENIKKTFDLRDASCADQLELLSAIMRLQLELAETVEFLQFFRLDMFKTLCYNHYRNLDPIITTTVKKTFPLAWKLKYYRSHVIRSPSSAILSCFDKNEYLPHLLTFDDFFKQFFSKLLGNNNTFLQHVRGDLTIFRPRIWADPKLFASLINMMVYSIIRYERSIALLDTRYCDVLNGCERAEFNFSTCDFNYFQKLQQQQASLNETIPSSITNMTQQAKNAKTVQEFRQSGIFTFANQRQVMDKIYRLRNLEQMFLDENLCKFLTKNITF